MDGPLPVPTRTGRKRSASKKGNAANDLLIKGILFHKSGLQMVQFECHSVVHPLAWLLVSFTFGSSLYVQPQLQTAINTVLCF